MTEQFQLPYGAISPASKPVDFFIAPSQRNIAQPAQPAQLSAPKGVSTVGTGGTTFVQGSNQFRDLAQSLAPFSKALVETLQTTGLQYAAWQMDQGEQAAMEQLAEAQARLDEEMETSELNRAAANREVAYSDPAAGGIMDLLNPYRQIGYQRGKAKLAGQEIELGMAGYVASRAAEIDYQTPDQGFGALQKIRADYTNEVLDRYGVDNGTPGFSKYTAPRIEAASDDVAQSLQKDRVKWLDSQKPPTVAALIMNEWDTIQSNGYVMLNGQRYDRFSNSYEGALKARLNQLFKSEMLTSGLPGQAAGWQEEVFNILAARRDYSDGASPLSYLDTDIQMRDENGNVLLDANGNPRFYSVNDYFSRQSIDSKIKYGQAAYQETTRRRKELSLQLAGQLAIATAGMPAGPERYEMGKAVVESFISGIENATGKELDAGTKAGFYETWDKSNKTTLSLAGQMDDPGVASKFELRVQQSFGSNFNATNLREELAQLIASTNDPALQEKLRKQGEAAITAKEKQEDVYENYGTTFKRIIANKVAEKIAFEYPRPRPNQNTFIEKAKGDMNVALEAAVADALAAEEADRARRLTQAEAATTAKNIVDNYDYGQIKFIDGETLREKEKADKDFEESLSPTWQINQLGDIPNRRVVLRDFRETRILDSSAIEEAVRNANRNYGQKKQLKRAWRDAGAESLFDFVESQLELLKQQVPGYEVPWKDSEWRRFRDQNLRSAGLEKSLHATQRLSETRPQLASIQGWIIPSVFQV